MKPVSKPSKPTGGKPLNIHNFDAALWERFKGAVRQKKGTIAGYLEEAVRAQLEKDGF